MDSIALALKALRNETTPKLSSRAVAEALDMPASTYAAYEDPKKFKKPVLPFELAKRISTLFEERGVDRQRTMALAGLTGEFSASAFEPSEDNEQWLEVSGAVAAGVWLQQSDWAPQDRYEIKVGAAPFKGAERFAVQMQGRSMDLTIPPGSDLECLRVQFGRVEPKPGDLVIVSRTAHDLVELTCKRLDREGDQWLLRAESTLPEFERPVFIGNPNSEAVTDEPIEVIGIVLSARLDLAPKGLSERRFRHRS